MALEGGKISDEVIRNTEINECKVYPDRGNPEFEKTEGFSMDLLVKVGEFEDYPSVLKGNHIRKISVVGKDSGEEAFYMKNDGDDSKSSLYLDKDHPLMVLDSSQKYYWSIVWDNFKEVITKVFDGSIPWTLKFNGAEVKG